MQEPFKQMNESYLYIENWRKRNPNLRAGFTTRNGGVSLPPYGTFNCGLHVNDRTETVIENRTILASKLNMPLENWVSGEQVHGKNVQIIVDSDRGRGAKSYDSAIKGIDGLITNKKGILCTAFFADCVPLYFYDPETEFIGIAHAGWKGTVNRIQEQMVQELKGVGVEPANLLVAIGPSISQKNYEVDSRVIGAISEEHKQKTVIAQENNRYLLDLKQLNVEILLQSGVLRHNIEVTNYCTYQDEALFFSHRRDNGKTGRMLGFLGFQA